MGDRWLLDTNVISLLFEESCEGALGKAGAANLRLATTARVIEELKRSRATNRPWAARCAAWVVPSGMDRLEMELGDEAWGRYDVLRKQRRTRSSAPEGAEPTLTLKDQGELTCIAHAAADPGMVFVAHDRNALWWAAHEVVPCARIASVASFVRLLREGGHVTADECVALGRNRNLRDHLPTWWGTLAG